MPYATMFRNVVLTAASGSSTNFDTQGIISTFPARYNVNTRPSLTWLAIAVLGTATNAVLQVDDADSPGGPFTIFDGPVGPTGGVIRNLDLTIIRRYLRLTWTLTGGNAYVGGAFFWSE